MSVQGGGESVYQWMLRLFPRQFREEFAAEMQDAFHDLILEARQQGRGSLAQVFFFELVDLPFCLITEHVAHLRKEWPMNRIPHGSRSLRSAEMGALGLLLGLIIYLLAHRFLVLPDWWYNVQLGETLLYLRDAVAWTLASALLGLFLALSVGDSHKAVVRTCLIMAALAFVRGLFWVAFLLYGPGAAWTKAVWSHQRLPDSVLYIWDISSFLTLGLFSGIGLGFTSGGWRACVKFAMLGMLAYGSGYGIFLALSHGMGHWLPWLSRYPVHVVIIVQYLAAGFLAIVAGGMLGWFWGGKGIEKRRFPSTGSSGPTRMLAVF